MKRIITIIAVLFSLSVFASEGDTLIYTINQTGDNISFTYKDTSIAIQSFDTVIVGNSIIDNYTDLFPDATFIQTQVNRADLTQIYKVRYRIDGIMYIRYFKDGPPADAEKAVIYVEYLKSLIPKQ